MSDVRIVAWKTTNDPETGKPVHTGTSYSGTDAVVGAAIYTVLVVGVTFGITYWKHRKALQALKKN